MKRLMYCLLGTLVYSRGLAACPVDHFSWAHEAARLALEASAGPRMAYIPRNVLDGDDPKRSLQFLCERVAEAMRKGSTEVENFAIASVDDAAEMWLLNCIAETNQAMQFPLLHFVFVGSPANEAEARAIVEAWEAEFYFVSDRAFEESRASECGGPKGLDDP